MLDRSKSDGVGARLDRFSWLPAAAAAALSLALYAVTLGGTYIFDDRAIILEDPRIADPRLWPLYLTTEYLPGAPDNLYRPLVSLSYAVQWRIHGDRAWAFHLVNWLLAAGAAAAVAEFARRLAVQSVPQEGSFAAPSRRGLIAGLVAGVLFAAHPLHVEAVAGLVGRAELVCTLATFAGLLLFLRRPLTGSRAIAIVACYFVALFSKEQGVLFPLLLAVLALFRVPRAAVSPRERTCNKWLVVSFIWLEAAYLLFREQILKFEWAREFLNFTSNPLVNSTGLDRWLMPLVLLGRYAVLFVAPYKLSLDYGSSVIGATVRYHEPYFYLGIAAAVGWMIALAVTLWLALRRERQSALAGAAAFALFGAALTLGMVSNFLTLIGTIFGERLAYMPSAFLAVLAGLVAVSASNKTGLRRGIAIVVGVLVVLGSIRTVTYAKLWNDRVALYTIDLAEQPKSVRLHALLYNEYKFAGDWEKARAVGERCRREVPQWWESWVMCIEPDFRTGRLQRALDLTNQALRVCMKDRSDALIYWWADINTKLREQNPPPSTRPATQPAP